MRELPHHQRPLIFPIYKPVGESSTDCVRAFKRILREKFDFKFRKIGHFGTLDPFADGLLLVGVNEATKLMDLSHRFLSKTYYAIGVLGVETPSGDTSCDKETWQHHAFRRDLSFDEIQQSLLSFKGEYLQIPPSYSATKHQGKALYRWAREGIHIKKDPVIRTIYDIHLENVELPRISFSTKVSGGTYIRVLFEDLAKKLATRGSLEGLTRKAIGKIGLANAVSIERYQQLNAKEVIESALSPRQFISFESMTLTEHHLRLLLSGQRLRVEQIFSSFSDDDQQESYFWISSEREEDLCLLKVDWQSDQVFADVIFSQFQNR